MRFGVKDATATSKSNVNATILTVREARSDALGYVETILRSTQAGRFVVTLTMDNMTVETKPITFTSEASAPSKSNSTYELTNSEINADDTAQASFRLTLKDQYGNTMTGRNVSFKAYENNTEVTAGLTITAQASPNGVYSGKLKGTKAGVYEIRAMVDSVSIDSGAKTITLTPLAVDASKSSFAITNDSMVAGSAGADFTLTLKDVYENLISGKTVTFQALNSTTNDVVSAITFEGTGSENGVYARKMKEVKLGFTR